MIPQQIVKFILDTERNTPPSKWPGGYSGVTIGYGYDLGYENLSDFEQSWGKYLPLEWHNKLLGAIGLKGKYAKEYASKLKDIVIPNSIALDVFTRSTLPKYTALTARTFDGFYSLPALVQGVLVSLVYNRGASLLDSDTTTKNRLEMRNIRNLVAVYSSVDDKEEVLQKIADELRNMKRLWYNKGLDGLIERRENEAKFVEQAKQEIV